MPRIPADARVALVGTTGSGKSYLARQLLLGVKRLVAINPKGEPDFQRRWGLMDWRTGRDILRRGELARVYIGPPDGDAAWEVYFAEIFQLRGVICYIDELYGVGPNLGSPGLRKLYTQGRALGIGVWAAFQRPSQIPLFALSEARYKLTFLLDLKDDRDRMAQQSGLDALPPRAQFEHYEFVLSGPGYRPPVLAKWKSQTRQLDILRTL